jgi:hypothetical protein
MMFCLVKFASGEVLSSNVFSRAVLTGEVLFGKVHVLLNLVQ